MYLAATAHPPDARVVFTKQELLRRRVSIFHRSRRVSCAQSCGVPGVPQAEAAKSRGTQTKRGQLQLQGSRARSSRLLSTEDLVRVRVSFFVGVPAEQNESERAVGFGK